MKSLFLKYSDRSEQDLLYSFYLYTNFYLYVKVGDYVANLLFT